jgi:stage II sporulation protein D
MHHEIHRRKKCKISFKSLLVALLTAPAAVLALALLCLGRSLFGGATAATTADSPILPLTAPLRSTADAASVTEAVSGDSESGWDASVNLTLLVDGETVTTNLADYLWGVVAAEMPASFAPEALKAQAVAARTYTVYQLLHPKGNHEADLCADPSCCQAWMSRQDRLDSWSDAEEALVETVTQAVAETDGMAVCYEGAPIQAVFHAASDGVTRSAASVWGTEVAYLQSVSTPEGDETPNYYSVVTCSAEAFAAALPECDLTGDIESWIGPIHYDNAGLSDRVEIGGVDISTSTLRSRFQLRSTSLTLEAQEDTVTFYVTGYGHGVGMSQYGANALAQQGFGYGEILTWYYSGTTVENLADKALNLE